MMGDQGFKTDVESLALFQRIMPTTWLLLAVAVMIGLHVLIPVAGIVPRPWNLLGVFPLLAGVALNLIADRDFRCAATTVRPFEESTRLLAEGVFHFSRNPMYLGFILTLLGIALLLGTLSPWTIIIAFTLIIDRCYVAVEEQMLAETFGPQWRRYTSLTRRWL